MADNQAAPDWNLLPHRPEAFFDLPEGYDRKQLKRSYNRLLKQFKPEKYPAEFQRIRAAYEQLDNQLRYGRQMGGHSLSVPFNLSYEESGGQPADVQFQEQESNRQAASTTVHPIWKRLETESPDEILAELKNKTDKTAFHYYAIGILADSQADADQLTLLKWILKGLESHPQDPALFRILYQLLRQRYETGTCRKLVLSVAKIVRDDRFYMLTEPLWDHLIAQLKFSNVVQLLQDCESHLKDYRVNGQVAFYMHLAKRSMFRGTVRWLEEAFHTIESHHDALGNQAEAELEVLHALLRYRQLRHDFLDGNALFTAIDQVVIDYCELDDFEAEKSFIDLQVQIASKKWDVLEAFPAQSDPPMDALFECWLWIDADIASRYGIEEVDLGSNLKRRTVSIVNLLETIERKTGKDRIGWIWLSLGQAYEVTRFAAAVLSIVLMSLALVTFAPNADGAILALAIGFFIIGGILLAYVGGSRWLLPWFQKLYIKYATKTYERIWRNELELYVRQTALPFPIIIKLIHAIADENSRVAESLLQVGHSDIGLGVTAMSMKYLS